MPVLDPAVLDDPVGESLRGHHAHLARRVGRAVGYVPEVATFVAVPRDPAPEDWADLAELLGRGGFADLFSSPSTPPEDWPAVFSMDGVQMVGPASPRERVDGPEMVELGAGDVREMLDLARRTRPGPFWRRTIEMGTYLGIRDEGRLVAMVGERLRPPGWTEISAVCTAPEARSRGLASRLVDELAARIVACGERPFLHVSTENPTAIALYERLGFTIRREVTFRGFRTPG
jgi:ribosomal protein S18 acetylase RimI-like enzyme